MNNPPTPLGVFPGHLTLHTLSVVGMSDWPDNRWTSATVTRLLGEETENRFMRNVRLIGWKYMAGVGDHH